MEQGYLSIKFLLGHLRENSLTGQHLIVLLSQVNTVSGSSTSFWEEVKTLRNYVPHSWLSSIRHFLNYSWSTIKIYKAWIPYLQHDYDTMLMDQFEREKPGNTTLDNLSRARMYLGATSLADICNDEGKWIKSWALTAHA
eukprot:3310964-Ditylum_brightwellii.AAC.1